MSFITVTILVLSTMLLERFGEYYNTMLLMLSVARRFHFLYDLHERLYKWMKVMLIFLFFYRNVVQHHILSY